MIPSIPNNEPIELTKILVPEVGRVTVVTEPITPEALAPGQVRIQPAYLGICGSDLHVFHGQHPVGRPPIVLGHELSAVVTEVADDVTQVSVGDIAVIDPIHACGQCAACRAGRVNLCTPPQVAGFRAPGYGRSSHVVPAANVHVAPADMSLQALVLAEPAACASHCVARLGSDNAADVLVIGAGTIGLSIVQALRITGAERITVVEFDARKRELARSLGADEAVAPGDLADDRVFTGVIDAVTIQVTLDEAIRRVIPGGRVVMMGVPAGPLSVDAPAMQRFERDLVGSGMYVPGDFDRAVAWIAAGEFQTDPLITDVFEIHDVAAAMTRAEERDSIKVLVRLTDADSKEK